jgi:2-polyprenyl-3-methyl-5-hydroxy-6-metoxy-1,4-benzoquinol methylase
MNKKKCLSCESLRVELLFSLGEIPLVNNFIYPGKFQKTYPLDLYMCVECSMIQLGTVVPQSEIFSEYLHVSGGSTGNLVHLKNVADVLNCCCSLKNKKVLEIGSNDGALLSFMKDHGAKVIGIDPAKNLVPLNVQRGVKQLVGFFDENFHHQDLVDKYDLIVALNVMAHTSTFLSAFSGVKKLLADDGIFIMENAYLLNTIMDGQFDTIYHEHIFCFSLHSLMHAYSRAGLMAYDAEIIPTQGGSIRVWVAHQDGGRKISSRLSQILSDERNASFDSVESFKKVSADIKIFREKFNSFILDLDGEKAVGIGAPARGVVISNLCNLDESSIDFIVDDTPLKWGRCLPGTSILIRGWDSLSNDEPRTYIIFSWNYFDNIFNRMKKMGLKGKVLIPFPNFKIIEI